MATYDIYGNEISEKAKQAARSAVHRAVRSGKLIKPKRCEFCGEEVPSRRLHAHHPDYDMPLFVQWLCASCHGGGWGMEMW